MFYKHLNRTEQNQPIMTATTITSETPHPNAGGLAGIGRAESNRHANAVADTTKRTAWEMKILRTTFCTILTLTLIFSCEQNNSEAQNQFDFQNLELDLDLMGFLDMLGERNPIEGSLEEFIAINYSGIENLDSELELILGTSSDGNYFIIQELKNSDPNSRTNLEGVETVCKTCRSESCVENTLSEAIGEGDTDVDIQVRVVRTMGVQTGLRVCYDRYTEG